MYSVQVISQHHFQCKIVCTTLNKIRYIFHFILSEWSDQIKHSEAKGIKKDIKNFACLYVYGWEGVCLSVGLNIL